MSILASRVRAQGGSVSTTIPRDAALRMGVRPGDELFWIEDGQGGYRITPIIPERLAMLRARQDVIADYPNVVAALESPER